jgi:hypothetical protein
MAVTSPAMTPTLKSTPLAETLAPTKQTNDLDAREPSALGK